MDISLMLPIYDFFGLKRNCNMNYKRPELFKFNKNIKHKKKIKPTVICPLYYKRHHGSFVKIDIRLFIKFNTVSYMWPVPLIKTTPNKCKNNIMNCIQIKPDM